MKVVRHGKPHGSYLRSLKQKAEQEDYDKLVTACIEALVSGERSILVSFAYVAKMPKDFPKGKIHSKVDDKNIRIISALKLLHWLKKHGYTTITPDAIRQRQAQFGKFLKENLDFEIGGDIENTDDN